MKKKVCIVLLFALLVSSCSNYHSIAELGDTHKLQPLRYTYIRSVVAYLSIDNGVATCTGAGDSKDSSTTTTVRVTLQKRVIGMSGWANVCTWTDTKSGYSRAYVSETKSISRGYDYRVYTYCIIKDSNGNILESHGCYSAVESYPS